jgi:putative transport protein
MVEVFVNNPLLLLFVIAAISYPLGRLKIKGTSLGVAAVLFVSIAVGALDPALKLPEVIFNLGAVLFVYTLGLSGGPGFVASFRSKGTYSHGLRDSIFITAILLGAAGIALLAHFTLHLKPGLTAGMYAGSLTNTPALAGVVEYLRSNVPAGIDPATLDTMLAEPVIGYSIAYPLGVISMIACILVVKRFWKVDFSAEANQLQSLGGTSWILENRTVHVTRADSGSETLKEMTRRNGWEVNFGRIKRHGELTLASPEARLVQGDLVSMVGSSEEWSRSLLILVKLPRKISTWTGVSSTSGGCSYRMQA